MRRRIRRTTLLLGLALACASWAQASVRTLFQSAQQAYRSGDYEAAQRALHRTWLELSSTQRSGRAGVKVLVMVGKVHGKTGHLPEAGAALGRALQLLQASTPDDDAATASIHRLLMKIDSLVHESLGATLLAEAEELLSQGNSREAGPRLVAAEALLRVEAEFGDERARRLHAQVLLHLPGPETEGPATLD